MTSPRQDIRIALPSKGRLTEPALQLMADAGLRVHKPNPGRQRGLRHYRLGRF
ncbi:MAG: hypothetical protein P8Y03_20825 [Anaerolineales bacterium]